MSDSDRERELVGLMASILLRDDIGAHKSQYADMACELLAAVDERLFGRSITEDSLTQLEFWKKQAEKYKRRVDKTIVILAGFGPLDERIDQALEALHGKEE